MEAKDYIDWDEGRDFADASCSEAIHVCENCRRPAERLTLVPEFEYLGCDECMEEAMAVIEREASRIQPAKYEPMQGVLFGRKEVA